jgi:hypothetical protein
VPYVEPLSDARTPLAGFFRTLLVARLYSSQDDADKESIKVVITELARSVRGQVVKRVKLRPTGNANPFSTREIAIAGWCGCR